MTETQSAADTADEAAVPSTRAGLLLGVLIVSAFVMILNETILSVALHALTVDLHISATTAQWLTSGFLLTMAVVIPVTGFLLERFRPRAIFMTSLSLFSVGTLVGALAPGFGVLLVGRVIQAAGTALMLPMLMTTVMRLVPPHRRGATMGTVTIVIAVAPALGPTIGGAILEYLGWRWMFWAVLPLALIALVIGSIWLRIPTTTRKVRLDVGSVLLSAVGFATLLYGLSSLGESAGGSHIIAPWLSIVIGVVALVLFVWRQLRLQRRDEALLDLRTFNHRRFRVSLLLAIPTFMALLGGAAVLLPLFLQTVLGTSTFVSGLVVLPGGLVMGALARPVGKLFDKVGARRLVIPGTIAMAAALWLFSFLGTGSPLWAAILIHVLLMSGLGMTMTPLMTESIGSLPAKLSAYGSATLNTLQQVAGSLGTALLVTISALATADAAPVSPDATGLRTAFMAAGGIGILAVIVSLFMQGRAKTTDDDTADTAAEPVPTAHPAADTAAEPARPAAAPVALAVTGAVNTQSTGRAVITLVDAHGRQRGRTDVLDGHYRLDLPGSGPWQLVASAPGFSSQVRRLLVVDGQPVFADLNEDFHLDPQTRVPATSAP